ncbi:MAG: NfeD family protein [Chlamydiia bacterium]|nr:NfeD family protein [Chlamydiia bacterium]
MISVLFFLLVGYLLIALEFYLPGAVAGTTGGLFLLYSVFRFIEETGSPLSTALYVIVVTGGLALLIHQVLRRIRLSGAKNTIYLENDQEGYVGSTFDSSLIAKVGVAQTDLRPSGHILIDGVRYHASADTGYIPKGESVKVIRGMGATLFVVASKK